MFDGDKDGVYEFATSRIPTGAYEVKVAHGLSWDENYGVDGVPGGANYSFSATDGKQIVFRYTLATHVLEIEQTDPPLARHRPAAGALDRRRDDRVAFDAGRADAADASWQLNSSDDATLALSGRRGHRRRAPSTSPSIDGGLTGCAGRRGSPRSPTTPPCTSRVRIGMPSPRS